MSSRHSLRVPRDIYFMSMEQPEKQQILVELRESISAGHDWYRAMLHAIRLWPCDDEEIDGETYVYLIDDEALDLMRLCERMSIAIADLVPEEQIIELLTHDNPPSEVSREELKSLLGPEKYRGYLSYLYGVLVEELVPLAVLDELRKSRRAAGLTRSDVDADEAYEYVYGSGKLKLADLFQTDRGLPHRRSMTLTQMKDFTYWLFKLRLRSSDKARVASDTKRALTTLHRHTAARARLSL